MTVSTHNDFSAGMIKDPQPGALPENAVSDAQDVFFDVPSKVRRRSVAVKPVSATSQTASAVMIGYGGGAGSTGGFSRIYEVYGIKKDGNVQFFDSATGVATSLGSALGAPEVFGRSVWFFGIALFPTYQTSVQSFVPAVFLANASGNNSYSPPAGAVATVTAGSPFINFSAGAFTTGAQATGGQFVLIVDSSSSGTRNIYLGTMLPTGPTTIRVDPIPTKSFTATQGAGTGAFVSSTLNAFTQAANPNTVYSYGARCAAVHQNRVLLGGVARFNTSTSDVEDFPQSVFYTILPDAKAEQPSQNVNAQGHAWFFREAIEVNNRFDIGGSDPIIALAPIDDNELLILTSSRAWRLSGYLLTRTTNDAGGVTYDVHPIPRSPGILSERSVQQTPHGLVFAGKYDLYLYAGGGFTGLLGRANSQYWQSLMRNRAVLGSHMMNDDFYVISIGTDLSLFDSGGGGSTITLCYHIPTRTLSRITGNSLVLFNSVRDPGDPDGKIGMRWWDSSLTAPSMTGSQLVYTKDVTSVSTSGTTDPDGNTVTSAVTTRIYDEGSPDQKKRFWRTVWRTAGTPDITLNAAEGVIQGSPSPKTIGTPASAFSSFTGPVIHSTGVQYVITDTGAGGDLLYGFDHYFDALPYARAS